MCGISGFNFKDEGLAQEMVGAMKHRGPDDEGVYIDENMSLGHNRLAIIDLSPAGHQPMVSRDGQRAIVYNGELYNFPEIKKELEAKGRKFASKSDTEVILQAYEEYGEKCLDRFNGIFAFAIWDGAKKELFLARDHFGVKPLFYFWDGRRFIFASEIKAILKHKIEHRLNMVALNTYFRLLYIPGPETIWQNIYKLQPAHYLTFKNNEIKIKKYWEIGERTEMTDRDDIKSKIRECLRASVKRQLLADVPVGLFLSGGLDSTAILGAMHELATGKIKTFSIGFETPDSCHDKFNEDCLLARKTADHYGTEHHEIMMKEHDLAENLEKTAWHMDDLVYSPTQITTLILAQLARQHVKVALGGDGGDELFGGYNRYYYYDRIEKWQKLPELLRKNALTNGLFRALGKSEIYKKINLGEFDLFWSFQQKEDLLGQVLEEEINDLSVAQEYVRRQSGLDNGRGMRDEARKR